MIWCVIRLRVLALRALLLCSWDGSFMGLSWTLITCLWPSKGLRRMAVAFEQLSTVQFQQRMKPAAHRIYQAVFPGCKVEDLRRRQAKEK